MKMLRAQVLIVAACLGVLGAPAQSGARQPVAFSVDGGRYFGPLKAGKFHGRGRMEWANGAYYEGQFADGLMHGRGKFRYANGQLYEGEFAKGMMSGKGRMEMPDGSVYAGEFRADSFDGTGELVNGDGRKYRGEFRVGQFNGKGRFEDSDNLVYEGDFVKGEFTGNGSLTRGDGSRYEGGFLKWRMHGKGRFTDSSGTVYEGAFADGQLGGIGRVTRKDGALYEGELSQWQFHGQGTLRQANGDEYRGAFQYGLYEGEGTLTYAKPRADGHTQDSGVWRYGRLNRDAEEQQTRINVEQALHEQRGLLDKALGALASRSRGKINLYLLAVAGDGSQEVFRREVEFVRSQFDARFGTQGRSLALVNSRNTVNTMPMATVTNLREALKAIASRMDREQDILFLFLTSHGSRDHELALNQNGMSLRGLKAQELAELLKESGIRWKVVLVSACYAGGFIDLLKDDGTLIFTAARHDRRSFGCADENDFTYFGRAFFKEALPKAASFQDAFVTAQALVRDWEMKEMKDAGQATHEAGLSLPQIHDPAPVREQLKRWWAQSAAGR